MNQDRLNALALLSIEAQLVKQINFENIIDVFAQDKVRKKISVFNYIKMIFV